MQQQLLTNLANEMGTESYSDDSHAQIHPDDYKMSIAPDGHLPNNTINMI